MDEIEDLIQRTEGLRDQVETMQQMLQQLTGQIRGHLESLRFMHAGIRNEAEEESIHDAPTLLLTDLRADDPQTGPSGNGSHQNRRTLPRRKGHPVPVMISRPHVKAEPVQGWVIDRSPERLCLVADEELAVGALVNVRPVHNFANLNWYPIEIHNCRPERDIWILGCQFVRKISSSDLRLFS
jgi:hypothetical protein